MLVLFLVSLWRRYRDLLTPGSKSVDRILIKKYLPSAKAGASLRGVPSLGIDEIKGLQLQYLHETMMPSVGQGWQWDRI